jgi:hypothetical protein
MKRALASADIPVRVEPACLSSDDGSDKFPTKIYLPKRNH